MGGCESKQDASDGQSAALELCENFTECPPRDADVKAALEKYDLPGWRGMGEPQYRDFLTLNRRNPPPTWSHLYKSIKSESTCLGITEFEIARKLNELKTMREEQCANRQMLRHAGQDATNTVPDEDDCEPILSAVPNPETLPKFDWKWIKCSQNDAIDSETIGKAAVQERNKTIIKFNNLVERFNFAATECDKFVCMMAANMQKLLRDRDCLSMQLATMPKPERHISEALQMVVNQLQQSYWELNQVEEVLGTLAFTEPRTRRIADKAVEDLRKAKELLTQDTNTSKSISERRNMINEFQEHLGKLDGVIRDCLLPSIRQWHVSRFPIRAAMVTFLTMIEDGIRTGMVEDAVKKVVIDSNLDYGCEDDWLDKLAKDKGPLTALFEVEQTFQFLDSLPDMITSNSLTYTELMRLEESNRPWRNPGLKLEPMGAEAQRQLRLMRC